MIRVRHVILPAGLAACVRRDDRGELEVFVAAGLEPARVRSAVRIGLRSYGARGWRAALLPVLLLLPLSGGMSWLRALARLLRAHAIGAAAAATGVGVAAATSAVLIVSAPPQQHVPVAGASPAPARLHHRSHSGGAHPARPGTTVPAAIPTAVPGRTSGHHGTAGSQPHRSATTPPRPKPAPSTAAPAPSPSPSPSPAGSGSSGGSGCLHLLGLSVCL